MEQNDLTARQQRELLELECRLARIKIQTARRKSEAQSRLPAAPLYRAGESDAWSRVPHDILPDGGRYVLWLTAARIAWNLLLKRRK